MTTDNWQNMPFQLLEGDLHISSPLDSLYEQHTRAMDKLGGFVNTCVKVRTMADVLSLKSMPPRTDMVYTGYRINSAWILGGEQRQHTDGVLAREIVDDMVALISKAARTCAMSAE